MDWTVKLRLREIWLPIFVWLEELVNLTAALPIMVQYKRGILQPERKYNFRTVIKYLRLSVLEDKSTDGESGLKGLKHMRSNGWAIWNYLTGLDVEPMRVSKGKGAVHKDYGIVGYGFAGEWMEIADDNEEFFASISWNSGFIS
ncbi:hypothetical protein M422DRAFT_54380 [Sphaerobolus stellatus SS14]|uniref:Uncharacterized protein n=1 Tax=Sphaerobolus stellatus (strain SS14) TaxID=990650 RepID=A0A0C9UJE0_SPHS4|nr:hypothetical protein M422DRAFT_54380 [Sphaerobolus stellatus SS14]